MKLLSELKSIMANTTSALKRIRQNQKCRLRNASQRSKMRNVLRGAREAIEAKDLKNAELAFREASSQLHRSARKGIIHKNTAARTISRMAGKIKSIS